jgi:hypothetical protein
MSNFISSCPQMKIFGVIIILLNITHVLNVSFCSSLLIKKVQYKNIKTGKYYQNKLYFSVPPSTSYDDKMEKRNVPLTRKQYSAPKNGHLQIWICIKLVIHFLSFHLIKLISPFE